MRRSFRSQLAVRFTAAMTLGLVAVAALSWLAIRETLDRELNASLLNVASIQAASVTAPASGAMEFHEWELTPEEAASIRELNRFAQVWNASGQSLLRTQYITRDLPLDAAALRRAAAGELVMIEQRFQGLPIRSLYYPLERLGPAHEQHVLQVAAPLEGHDRILRGLAIALAALVLLTSLTTYAGSWWLAKRAVQPVHEIIDQTEALGAGSLDQGISATAHAEEYHRLVSVLNGMLARLREAFEAQRRFTADASHELRSPLTALRGELELARRRDRQPEEYRRVIDSALEEVDRLSRVTENLLTLARSDAGVMQPRLQPLDLGEILHGAVGRLERKARASGTQLDLRRDGDARLKGDPDLLARLVWNLLDNAIKYTPRGGRVEARTEGDARTVSLHVTDQGPGIPEKERDRIFERFYRLDPSRTPSPAAGTGLGLAIVRSITEAHGGTLAIDTAPGGGAHFTITLPREPV